MPLITAIFCCVQQYIDKKNEGIGKYKYLLFQKFWFVKSFCGLCYKLITLSEES